MAYSEPTTVKVQATADGVNNIVAAVASAKIRVIAYALTAATTAGLVTIQDTTGTPVVVALLNLAIGMPACFNGDERAFAFETSTGKGLDFSNATGVDVYGHITYVVGS